MAWLWFTLCLLGSAAMAAWASFAAVRAWLRTSLANSVRPSELWVWVGAVLVAPGAYFLGFVVGGNLGGGLAAALTERFDAAHRFLIPLGIGIGLFVVTTVLILGGAGLGALIARLFGPRRT